MSYPILYSATETDFNHNGLGILGDCVSYRVVAEGNGAYDLTMLYPMDGIHFYEITDRAIIKAKFDKFVEPQLFRVKTISKAMSGNATVYAEHISYDLSGIPVKPFTAESANLALTGLKSNAVVDCPFEFWTDKSTTANFKVSTPASIRSRLGGVTGSILDVYGGEYEFDNYTVKLHNERGMNRGVSIRYGKNLTDIQQEQNCASVYTGVYPYWYVESDAGNVLIELPEKIVNAPGTYNFTKILTVDFSQAFEVQPTVSQLREKTQEYIKSNNIGVPIVSLTASFVQLAQYAEYKHLELLERISLFDTINVEFPALGVSATAKVVKIVYDGLAGRIESITLGSVRANIADTIAAQQQEIEKKPSKTFMERAIESLTKTILGANGGSVRFLDTNEDGEPDTLYIADDPDPTQAVKVWRFNYEGWGASKNGYNGPFEMGATFDDGIVANFITTGTLNAKDVNVINLSADNINSGTLNANDVTIINAKAESITSGVLDAKKVTIANLSANSINSGTINTENVEISGAISSPNNQLILDIDSGELVAEGIEGKTVFSNGKTSIFNSNGKKIMVIGPRRITGGVEIGGEITFLSEDGDEIAAFVTSDDNFRLRLPDENGHIMGWNAMWKYKEGIGYYVGSIV